jgi:hypothetical protein
VPLTGFARESKKTLMVAPFALLLLSISIGACSMPAGMNNDCEWPTHQSFAVDLLRQADQHHLAEDIRVAEELAIRFTDARGKLSPLAGQRLRDCEAKLFGEIARNHSVSLTEISETRTHLGDWRWDPAVHIPLATIYPVAVLVVVRRLRNRFARDEKLAIICTALFLSLMFGAAVLAVGNVWAAVVNMVRLGNTHMSYRAGRVGWREYTNLAFVTSALLFLLAVLLSYHVELPDNDFAAPRNSK